jgi:mRNA interferase RelE/StbE
MSEPSERRWHVIVARQADKVLARAPRDLALRLYRAIQALADGPRHAGCAKLVGYDLWRVRVGDWRIIYRIEDDRLVVVVIEIATRGAAYRELAE